MKMSYHNLSLKKSKLNTALIIQYAFRSYTLKTLKHLNNYVVAWSRGMVQTVSAYHSGSLKALLSKFSLKKLMMIISQLKDKTRMELNQSSLRDFGSK